MTSQSSRSSSIDAASVQSILSPGALQASDPPSPHIGTSPTRARFSMPPPARPEMGHSRALSYVPRRPNRLSLSFPIATGIAPYSADSSRPTPTSSSSQSFPPTPLEQLTSPTDPTGFLGAMASQERKVLELKDELRKAEAELKRLKRQWMSREAYKKDSEIKHREQLQPLPAVGVTPIDTEELKSNRLSMEIDKRKALLNNLNIPKDKDKDARRKFSGAHTRTLSLLSPERANYTQPFPFPPQESAETKTPSAGSIIPDTSSAITRINSIRNRHSYQSGVTHNVKLIAEDVKAGLWTFMEDIRQATIGDEASGPTSKGGLDPTKNPTKTALRKSSKNSLRNSEKRRAQSPRGSPQPRMRDSSSNSIFDVAEPVVDRNRTRNKSTLSKKKSSRKLAVAAPAIDDLDDSWSNWDSPVPKSPRWSGSTATTDAPPTPSLGSSDERGIKYTPSSPSSSHTPLTPFRIRSESSSDGVETPSRTPREDIQWPALEKLTPGNLKRTVSTIMQEWEKSLSPSPDVRPNPLSRGNSSTVTTAASTASEVKEAAEARRRSVQDLIIMSR